MRNLIVTIALLISSLSINAKVLTGAEQMDRYLPLLEGKRVAIVANQTSLCDGVHIVDTLKSLGVNIKYILSPEHGFRGDADAGERVVGGRDPKTNIEVISLYGSTKRPADIVMGSIDVLIYDLQDVGVRYFTYISTMKYCLEAAAVWGKEFMILDRPNPNGSYIDGPILEDAHSSFVGEFPIPVVYGMSVGELAQMAIGERWVKEADVAKLKVISCQNYSHSTRYDLPVKPSPNLPNMKSIYLYPSTCYFEATDISLGRGTDKPFQIFGHPKMSSSYSYKFTPRSTAGAKYPPQQNKICYGRDLSSMSDDKIIAEGVNLEYIIEAYNAMGCSSKFFNSFFEKLIGVSYVREMIVAGKSSEEIRDRWKNEVENFKITREKYLIYE